MGAPAGNNGMNREGAGNLSVGICKNTENCDDGPEGGIRKMPTRLHSLSDIIGEADGSESTWVSDIVSVTKERLGRIPRGGWKLIVDAFNIRFSKNMNISDVKGLMKLKKSDEAGKMNRSEENSSHENVEMSKFKCCLEELKVQFENLKNVPRESRKPTPKIHRKFLKPEILQGLNSAILCHIMTELPIMNALPALT